MDSTLNPAAGSDANPRLAAVRDVRSWRAGQHLLARVVTLVVPILAFLAWGFLALNTAQARVQIDFDPMRPPAQVASTVAADTAASGAAGAAPAAPALPTLKITRQTGSASTAMSALVNDIWVRRGDVVAGYRVTALRTESVDLVSVAEPSLHLTLRLNPVSVERADPSKTPQTPTAPPPAWSALALEKK